ncbi:hypothetical protein PQQ51_12945 [Paraburkholderia xenovorans]|uniref:hypothetical protein n=1 Tax=Paraburkholderia xenovorans TaxID=36873 RepID=UPI0038BAE2C0
MKLFFSWINSPNGLTPFCESDLTNNDGVSALSCLLMDDGGRNYLQTIPWIDEGISRLNLVVNGGSGLLSWDREAWGVKVEGGKAVIYSLIDEDYCEEIEVGGLCNALWAWRGFLRSTPDSYSLQEVEI